MEQMKIVYTLIYTYQSDKTSDWRDRDRSNNGKQFLKGWNGNGSSGIGKSFQRNTGTSDSRLHKRIYRVARNTENRNTAHKKGYLMITDLAASEEIKISCDMKARFVYANPKVRADEGKACIMRGPLVYCLEETDNGENLSSLYVDTKKR